MKKYNCYIKNFSLFLITELFVVFICSLINMFGISSSFSTVFLLIINLLLFFFFGYKHSIISSKKGYFIGFLNGFALLIFIYLINIIFFKGTFNINLITYYLALLLASIFGGMVGKTKKKED